MHSRQELGYDTEWQGLRLIRQERVKSRERGLAGARGRLGSTHPPLETASLQSREGIDVSRAISERIVKTYDGWLLRTMTLGAALVFWRRMMTILASLSFCKRE